MGRGLAEELDEHVRVEVGRPAHPFPTDAFGSRGAKVSARGRPSTSPAT